MRPIDADVLKQHIDKLPALPDGNFAGNHSALKALINMQPTFEPSTNCSEVPNNSDAISREKAKNAICNACGKIDCDEMDTCEKLDIPSEGSKALEWQYHSYIPHNKYCPKCKKDSPYNKRWNFCPNCGADMRQREE